MMNRHDAYYEPEDDYQSEELQVEIDELLKYDPDFDCTHTVHFGEAIQQAGDDDQKIIRDYIEQKDWAKLGLKLYTISLEYQEAMAESHLTN